ncbi:unnamed protein product [Boreogadus saida]
MFYSVFLSPLRSEALCNFEKGAKYVYDLAAPPCSVLLPRLKAQVLHLQRNHGRHGALGLPGSVTRRHAHDLSLQPLSLQGLQGLGVEAAGEHRQNAAQPAV